MPTQPPVSTFQEILDVPTFTPPSWVGGNGMTPPPEAPKPLEGIVILDPLKEYNKYIKHLWIIRGVPGSGKSTLASLIHYGLYKYFARGASIVAADDFFIKSCLVTGNLVYQFDGKLLPEAHAFCLKQTEEYMERGIKEVIVTNTFVPKMHIKPYLKLAQKYGYTVQEIICRGNFDNIHAVPPEKVRKLRQNFEF